MRGKIFDIPSSVLGKERVALLAKLHYLGGLGNYYSKWVESYEGGTRVWAFRDYDNGGQYAIQTMDGSWEFGCRAAIFVLDDKYFINLPNEEQASLLTEGVSGELFYVPGRTRFRTALQQDLIVDYKNGCWRVYTPIFDWF